MLCSFLFFILSSGENRGVWCVYGDVSTRESVHVEGVR